MGKEEVHNHDRGLTFDLATLNRRRALALFGGAGIIAFAVPRAGTADATTDATTARQTCEEIPEETAGPYPGDGSNGPNVLDDEGIVRSDLTTSFGDGSGTAVGIPLRIELTIQDSTSDTCASLPGAAVYLWHCDRDGGYSLYTPGIEDENYLRGVQVADENGLVAYTSIFPGCYAGRWPHIHFEIYAGLDDATSGGDPLQTSQLAFPEDVCNDVYATSGYEDSAANLAGVSLGTDMVFSDGWDTQLATMTGDVCNGYTATLVVPV